MAEISAIANSLTQQSPFLDFPQNTFVPCSIHTKNNVTIFPSQLSNYMKQTITRRNKELFLVKARIAIIVLTTAMALRQMGLADDIVNLAFGLTLGALAIAFALALGLGGREIASTGLRTLVDSMKSKRPS